MDSKGTLIKYSASAAAFSVVSWHLYQEYKRKAITGQTWDEVAREKRRQAAAVFCASVTAFHHNLRLARDYMGRGRLDDALTVLVECLKGWEFKRQTLKALKRHLHPEFFARLVNRIVEEKIFDCTDVFGHLTAPDPGNNVGLNMNLERGLH